MLCEDMRDGEGLSVHDPAAAMRQAIINQAADELQRATSPCLCSKNLTRTKPITMDINHACPEHGDE